MLLHENLQPLLIPLLLAKGDEENYENMEGKPEKENGSSWVPAELSQQNPGTANKANPLHRAGQEDENRAAY